MWQPVARPFVFLLAILALYLIGAFFVQNSYYQLILASIPIWASLATAWNVFSGYTGLISFGHSAFFAVGAYTVTLLFIKLGITPWIGLPLSLVVGALSALIIGIPTFRLRGHYFALAMLAYPLSLMYVFEWLGYQEITIPIHREAPFLYMQFANPFGYTVVAVGLLALCAVVSLFVERSRSGLILQTLKQNEMAAQAAGVNPLLWKTITLMLSGALAAAAGGVYITVLLVTTPREVFGVFVSASALIFAMFGGLGSVWGPLIGAALLVPMAETLHAELGHVIPGLQGIVYGAAIIVVTLLMPEGIYWRLRDRFFARDAAETPQTAAELPVSGADSVRLASDPAVLKLSGISKSFGAVTAARDVTIEIARGSITGIVGPNGAGKTTVFNIVNGFVAPDAGTISIDGLTLDGLPPYRRAVAGLGRTFQVARVFERLTVRDNIMAGAVAKGRSIAEARALADHIAGIVGLSTALERVAGSLPAFQIRLIEIARALAGSPRVLLLDETLAGLSSSEADEVVKVLRRVRDIGVTLVIIEHTMSVMATLVDRMIVLDHGAVIADGPPQEVLRDRQVIIAYLGQKWANRA